MLNSGILHQTSFYELFDQVLQCLHGHSGLNIYCKYGSFICDRMLSY